ncbi:MAG TPA: hypothetical protein VF175_08630 [Lacipirellula sp.]
MMRSIALLLAAVAAGCGGPSDKVPVEGVVTFNGKKVLNGDIRFVPEPGTVGTATFAPIVDGHFKAGEKGGVAIGEHRVILRAFILEDVGAAAGGGQGDILASGSPRSDRPSIPVYRFEGREQFLPPEYNARAGLTISVTGEQNPQIENFNLRDGNS